MEEHTKKLLIYGGAGASIIALYLYVKNKQSATAAAGYAPGAGSAGAGGASGDATSAAQINAATNLAIAQGNQNIALAQIAASTNVAGIQSQTALGVAGIQASAQRAAATTGALGSVLAGPAGSAGGTAIKGIFDLLGNAVKGIFGPTAAENLGFPKGAVGEPGATPIAISDGWQGPGGSFAGPVSYGVTGNIFGAGAVPGADYFQGSIGSGDNSWFGTSPAWSVGEPIATTEPPLTTASVDPYYTGMGEA